MPRMVLVWPCWDGDSTAACSFRFRKLWLKTHAVFRVPPSTSVLWGRLSVCVCSAHAVLTGSHAVLIDSHAILIGSHAVLIGTRAVLIGSHAVLVGSHAVLVGSHLLAALFKLAHSS